MSFFNGGMHDYFAVNKFRFEGSDTYAPAKYFGLADDIESHAIKGFIIPVQAIFDETVNVETIQDLLNA